MEKSIKLFIVILTLINSSCAVAVKNNSQQKPNNGELELIKNSVYEKKQNIKLANSEDIF